jgi:hypothetical protein
MKDTKLNGCHNLGYSFGHFFQSLRLIHGFHYAVIRQLDERVEQ